PVRCEVGEANVNSRSRRGSSMRSRSSGQVLVVALAVLLSLVSLVHAQTPSGEVSGTVIDASGLAVPGVTVTLTNQGTNVTRVVQTNESGLYVISAIPPGTYDLKAELSGFRTVERKGVPVQVGSASRQPFTMEVGEISETLQV